MVVVLVVVVVVGVTEVSTTVTLEDATIGPPYPPVRSLNAIVSSPSVVKSCTAVNVTDAALLLMVTEPS